ncbi:MAG: DUF6600 domain-containing protein [Thermodesulfobacteriota bacterium]
MNTKRTFLRIVVFLSITLLVAGAVQMPRAAWASMEDAAIFYEELNPHGEWVEYENYGPVWYPTQVQENWRPYVDGRWTPADEGYVFETQEPWGWATYHYGNWMPTEEYGWVWVPGRTWYPNTVTWRTSPDTESPDESYIGWAPIPPPNYVPQPGYYPEGYYGGGPYRGPVENLISAPFWIFVRAASFLLGFSEPYAPRYSYWGCGCLAPPPVVPYYYNRTVVVHNYYAPDYYPRGIWAGRGYYNWGPPIPYVSRVTRIKQVNINNYVRQVNIYQRRNVAPPPGLVARRSYFRQVLPPAMVQHRPLPRGQRIHDVQAARANLVRPHLLKAEAIKGAPAFRAQIPKTPGNRGRDGQWRRGVPGAALPASAMMRPNQQMENHVRKIPSSQRIQPVSPRGRQWQVPGMSGAPGTPGGQPAGFHKRRAPEAVTPGAATPRAAPPGAERARMRPGGPQGIPPTMKPSATPGTPGVAGAAGGRGHRAATIEGRPSRAPSPSPAAMTPARSQPGKGQPPGAWSRQKPTPPAAATRGKPQAQGQQRHYTPSSPGPGAAGPVRVQPPGRPPRSQPSAAPPQPQPQPKAQPQAQPQRQPRKFQPPKQSAPERPQGFGGGQPGMSRSRPDYRQYQPQPPRKVRQQPAPQAKPRVRQQPRPQPRPQVRQQPAPQPRPQVRQQPRPQMRPQVSQQPRPQPQRQVRQQPRPQARPQAQKRPQPQQGRDKQPSQQN